MDYGIGRSAAFKVLKVSDQGAFVDGLEFGELFVPKSQLPQGIRTGQLLTVFLYKDGDRVLATAKRPLAMLGQVARLKIMEKELGTAYLDLGIPKQLVLPISEQRSSCEIGQFVIVYLALDAERRLFATQRFNRYLKDEAPQGAYRPGQTVSVVPLSKTPMGFRVSVDDQYFGLLYRDNVKGDLILGKKVTGYIQRQRPDGRLDVSLIQSGPEGVHKAALELLQALHYARGSLDFCDSTPPQIIEDYLHMSKVRFKKACGYLYKKRFIVICEDCIELTADGEDFYEAMQEVKFPERAALLQEASAAKDRAPAQKQGSVAGAESAGEDHVAAGQEQALQASEDSQSHEQQDGPVLKPGEDAEPEGQGSEEIAEESPYQDQTGAKPGPYDHQAEAPQEERHPSTLEDLNDKIKHSIKPKFRPRRFESGWRNSRAGKYRSGAAQGELGRRNRERPARTGSSTPTPELIYGRGKSGRIRGAKTHVTKIP